MQLDLFQTLTVINSILIGFLPIVFFRRQKLDEIKYKEIMELNVKTHDITQRADKSIKGKKIIDDKDHERLDYLISRYKKHSKILSKLIQDYKYSWGLTIIKNAKEKLSEKNIKEIQNDLLNKSDKIRELADKLLK